MNGWLNKNGFLHGPAKYLKQNQGVINSPTRIIESIIKNIEIVIFNLDNNNNVKIKAKENANYVKTITNKHLLR